MNRITLINRYRSPNTNPPPAVTASDVSKAIASAPTTHMHPNKALLDELSLRADNVVCVSNQPSLTPLMDNQW